MKITRFTLFQVPPRWLFLHADSSIECKKISSMAEAFDVAVALPCPLDPIALAACCRWTPPATTPSFGAKPGYLRQPGKRPTRLPGR